MIGDIVRQEWAASSDATDSLVVLPNHLHGIVQVGGRSISEFVRGLKSAVTSRVRRELEDEVCHIWQRGYHDRILRDGEVVAARKYLATNPIAWLL